MRFVSKQKRDDYFMKKFRQNFPDPANAAIIWGAGFKQKRNYRGHDPTNSAEYFKQLLQKEGYKIFEVSEYNTSQKCHNCEQQLQYATTFCQETATQHQNQRLMRCTNRDCPFDTINRDKNAVRNIARAGFEIFFANKRPNYLTKPIDPEEAAKKIEEKKNNDTD